MSEVNGKAWVGRNDGEPMRGIQAREFAAPRRVGERSIEFDSSADAHAYLNGVIAKSDPEGVRRGDYFVDVDRGEAEEELPLFSVGMEVFVHAEHEHAAMTLVGEHFGSNLPDEIADYIVQDASLQS